MLKWLRILINTLRSALMSRRDLAVENLALRQQLAVYKETHPRPRLTDADRRFWVLLSRATLHIVRPDTVVRWHRQGLRCYWHWKSRKRGRPAIDPETIQLIRRMCRANPLWGAPRIHGELLKLGIEPPRESRRLRSLSQATMADSRLR
jgi:putative transposase